MTLKQKETIKGLKVENKKFKKKIKEKEFIRKVVVEKIVYKDLSEKPITNEEKYFLQIIMDYPNEKGNIILDTKEKIQRFNENRDKFIDVILPKGFALPKQNEGEDK